MVGVLATRVAASAGRRLFIAFAKAGLVALAQHGAQELVKQVGKEIDAARDPVRTPPKSTPKRRKRT